MENKRVPQKIMKKIIIVHLTGGPLIREGEITFTEGGLVHALSASVHLIDEYAVTILCLNPPGQKGMREIDYRDGGVKIVCLGSSKWVKLAQYGDLTFFREAYKYIKKSNPDILIGNNLLASFLVSFFPKGVKKIGIIHHLYLSLFGEKKFKPLIWLIGQWEKLAIIFLKKLDGIGVINPLVREILIKKGYPEEKIVVVGNGVDTLSYSFTEKKNPNSLIFIGRLAELKGVEKLIEVVAEIKKEFPQIVLHIGGDGPKYFDIKKKIKELGVENNVIMHGYLGEKEKIDLLKISAIYLSASQLEGFGIPLIEAMASGCIPVVSDIYAHQFIFQDRPVGYLVKNDKEMVEKTTELLKNEPKRLSLAKEGRILAEEKWSWEKVGQNYKKLLQI